jgi:hypothetical protein
MKHLRLLQVILVLLVAASTVNAQDMVVMMNGSVKHTRVRKVKDGMVVCRKYFRKTKIPTGKVLYVQYADGTKTYFNPVNKAKDYKDFSMMAANTPKTDSIAKKATGVTGTPVTPTGSHVYKIERIGDNFRLDTNEIVGYGRINTIMAQSGNPIVLVNLKAAKTMRMFHTITTIAAFPSSAGGAFASYNTFSNLFKQLKAGPAPFKTYLTAGLSFMATLSLPITQGILKHLQKKLYDKTLLMYSVGM